jgi:HAE1 family hydrophobic/amphiphilic exporter-1
MEAVAKTLPSGLTYFWTGSVFQQQRAGSQAPYIFAMALVFVFLVLAAQYESWIVPFAVILCIPFAVFGAFLGLSMRSMANDIYAQVGLVMLIGLAAKNAILIVEFAKTNYDSGQSICQSALNAARLRFRPIVMTALAFIVGCLPLWTASGSGAASRRILGTVVVGGMTLSTALGLIFIPVTFSVVEYLSHRFVRGGKGVTMDCTHEPIHNPNVRKLPTAAAQTEGGQG